MYNQRECLLFYTPNILQVYKICLLSIEKKSEKSTQPVKTKISVVLLRFFFSWEQHKGDTQVPELQTGIKKLHLLPRPANERKGKYSEISLLRLSKIQTFYPLKTLFAKFKLFFSSFSMPTVSLIRDHLWDSPKVVFKTTFGQSQRWSSYRNFTVQVGFPSCLTLQLMVSNTAYAK